MLEIHRHERQLEELVSGYVWTRLFPWSWKKQDGRLNEIKRQGNELQRKIAEGCFMRSLESAFNVEVTQAEWEKWFLSQEERLDIPDSEEINSTLREQEIEFLDSLSKGQTALARALAEYPHIQHRQISFDLIGQLLKDDKNIVLMYFLSHIAHIKVKNGKLITASDHGQEVNIPPETLCEVLVFSKLKS